MEGSGGFGVEAGDGFEEGCFTATGGADDGHEVSFGDFDGDVIDEVDFLAVFFNGEADVF